MPPKPSKPAGYGKSQKNKEWGKKVQFYGSIAAFIAVCGAIFLYAEYEQSLDRQWATSYERKCEACQTIITSGILTRSMIFQQEKKRQSEERAAVLESNPDAELPAEEEPQVGAQAVLRYMCNDQQIEQLLANNRFTFDNGYSTIEDPEFGTSLKKLCWYTMSNQTATKVLKRMLEVPMKPIQKPTLVSLSKAHFEPVCVTAMGMCTGEELSQGTMVDPQAEEATPEAPAAGSADAGTADAAADASASTPGSATLDSEANSKYTEL